MPVEHRPPTQATVKELYANAFRCAYPSCQRPLYKVDSETGERFLNSNVAHICARSEGGERWDADMTEEENRSIRNLLILCLEHAWEVDRPNRVDVFPPNLLRTWKQEQLKEFDAIGGQGWMLTSEMASEALRASVDGITIKNSVLHLGGLGGAGPGAGGGGGGVVGKNAKAGDGGNGGSIRYESIWKSDGVLNYKLPSGESPGAGGGGAGAEGENAVGGGGGGGGESVYTTLSLDQLDSPEEPLTIEVCIGEGGKSGRHPGEHSGNGGNTELRFVTADGKIVRSIVAKGGGRGQPGFAMPPAAREVTSAEIDSGLVVSTLMVADALHSKGGLLYVLGGAAESWIIPQLPADVVWPATVVVSMGQVPASLLLTFFIVVDDPNGQEIFRLPFNVIRGEDRLVANFTQCIAVQFGAEIAGIWSLRILSGGYEFARLPMEIRIQED
ncbi:hypothetical protein LOY70_10090 [Pseudomonas sp. B21-054]|uniref:glycine-rich domain-containing protein n=1 Tax=Pseudomonas sp. B21-054 TaxID=2895494 RepID=UPI002231F213|nr:hypothetical protein [Pseudomonas sp. B21-054]UZE19925.1 hypothetical protein LOY70_10090 [Pseudomonas sp. B21-054]